MDLNEYQRRRWAKVQAMRERGIDPYPARCERSHTIAEIWAGLRFPQEVLTVRGRLEGQGRDRDLVAGRERLVLLDLSPGFLPPAGEVVCCGKMGLSDQGRLALHVQECRELADPAPAGLLTVAEARESCAPAPAGVILTGRLTGGLRTMGKATFIDLEDGSVLERGRGFLCPHIQLFLSESAMGPQAYAAFGADFDPGDFVQASGRPFFTRAGQLSLQVDAVRMLAKALHVPPEKYHGLTDVETRLRERYADLMANEEVRHRFRLRARMVQAIRRWLDERGFLEVETPILQPIYGGAAARPFITHHNQLNQDLYLRISFELYLKRLIVGMYERVYEIGPDFRNEGVDRVHNPEFTMLELYRAYADYGDMMRLFEEMVAAVAREVVGGTRIAYQGQEIELSPPWRRVPLREAIKEHTGIDVERHPDAAGLQAAIRAIGGEVTPQASWARMVDYLLSAYVEPRLVQPTFLYDYPLVLSPLAKRCPDRPDLVERFEGFVAGMELCNAFSELNDPLDQEERFLAQGRAYAAGDAEAHPMDRDYLNAQMYGMPPTGGLGAGLDRLAMLLTDQTTIREVILFPHLRQG